MNRADFESLVDLRLDDAKAHLKEGRYAGSYYLAGYTVECALKVLICNLTRQHDFPPKKKFVDDCYSHDLSRLLAAAGLTAELQLRRKGDPDFDAYWNVVKAWSVERRYDSTI